MFALVWVALDLLWAQPACCFDHDWCTLYCGSRPCTLAKYSGSYSKVAATVCFSGGFRGGLAPEFQVSYARELRFSWFFL